MKRQSVAKTILTALAMLLLFGIAGMAQAPTIDNLVVQIWPEFDRPETLVIYQGQLAADESLPTTVTFQLPGRIETMHAVAVMSPEGNLVNAEYTLTPKDGEVTLSFTVDNPRFQFEYYDPAIIQKDGATRNLDYTGSVLSPVNTLQVELQQPTGAENMEVTPPADEVMTGSNNFKYFIYKKENVSPGQFISLSGKYTKQSDTLTADLQLGLAQPTVAAPSAPISAAMPGNNWVVTLGYVLVGLGAGVLLVVAGIWIFNNNRAAVEEPPAATQRPRRAKGRPPAPKPVRPVEPSAGGASKFCPECGARYKPSAKFCHQCGAPRR